MKHQLLAAFAFAVTLLVAAVTCAPLAAQNFMPRVFSAAFPLATPTGGVEVPFDPRLEMPEGEGTLEFWFTPQWQSRGQPEYHCVVVNGRSVHRRRAPDGEAFATFFDVRYAVYLSRVAIVFQSGSTLHVIGHSEFGIDQFLVGQQYHVAVATRGNRTTIVIDGTHSLQLDVGYGATAGSRTFIGGLPPKAAGVVQTPESSFFDGERWVDTLKIEDPVEFGPFRGQLGGVRLWSRHLGVTALSPPARSPELFEPAPILFYGQVHAERDLTPEAAGKGDLGVRRGHLIAFSDFDPRQGAAPRLRLADPIGGIWLDERYKRPEIQSKAWLEDLEPMTILQPCPIVVMVKDGNGAGAEHYKVYVDGEWSGDLVPSEGDPEHSVTYRDLDGNSYPIAYEAGADRMRIEGAPAAFVQDGEARRSTVTLVRDAAETKGSYTDNDEVFTVSLQERNWPFLLRSYDLLRLDPNRYWEANAAVLGVDKFLFERPGRYDFQLAKKVKLPWATYLNNIHQGGGGIANVTTTTERERILAVRAKFGVKGGMPGKATAGVEGSLEWQNETKAAGTVATTIAQAYDKIGTLMNDMVSARPSPEFLAAVQKLAAGGSCQEFIAEWGTHYARAMTTGSLGFRKRDFQESTIEELTRTGFDISAFVEIGNADDKNVASSQTGTKAGARIDAGAGTTLTERLKQLNAIENIDWTYVGGANKDPEHAASVNLDNSAPISFDLRPLHELLSPAYFEDPAIYIGARNRLRDAILDYLDGDEPSDQSPYRDQQSGGSLTFHVMVSRFRCQSKDHARDKDACEFGGRITAWAYENLGLKQRLRLVDGKQPTHPTELWNNTDKPCEEWQRSAPAGAAGPNPLADTFKVKTGAQFEASKDETDKAGAQGVPFETSKGMPPTTQPFLQMLGAGAEPQPNLEYTLDATKAGDFGVELRFLLAEDDAASTERYEAGTLALDLGAFLRQDTGRDIWATADDKRLHWVRLEEQGGGGYVEFGVETWVEIDARHWFNRDRSVFGEFAATLQHNVRTTRARSALGVLDAAIVPAADVLAYFPRDLDGLRRPGAREFDTRNPLPGLDMSRFSVQFDLLAGRHDMQLALSPASGDDYDGAPNCYFQYWADRSNATYVRLRDHWSQQFQETGEWDARLMLVVPPDAVAKAYAALQKRVKSPPGLAELDKWRRVGLQEYLLLDFDPEKTGKARWLTVGFSFDAETARLCWHVIDRQTMATVASGVRDYTSLLDARRDRAELLLSNVQPSFTPRQLVADGGAQHVLDEIYVLGCALSASQMRRLAEQSRQPAPIVVEPVAYWPFDTKRTAAPAMCAFPGTVGRVRDDALTLLPTPDRFEHVRGLDLRDLTLQFDFRIADATRTLTFGDDLGLLAVEVRHTNDEKWLGFRVGEGAPLRKLDGFVPEPYVWSRVAVTFDGLAAAIVADDGTGFVRTATFQCTPAMRDAIANQAIANAGRDVSWLAASGYNHPGTLLQAAKGYFPANADELTRLDEVRLWRGTQSLKLLVKSMKEPRQYSPPAGETSLLAYADFGPARRAGSADGSQLIARLVSPELRVGCPTAAIELGGGAAIDPRQAALSLAPGTSARAGGDEPTLSAFTLHLDFRPGNGLLRLSSAPFSFECEDGHPRVLVDTDDGGSLRYDPAFGDRIATGEWHKLVVAVDAWRSRMTVILDGESLGAVPLSRPVVDALRAADADPHPFRFELDGSAREPALVDEFLLLRPALGRAELDQLAGRIREARGAKAPTGLVRATGLGRLDAASSRLRALDGVLAEHVVAYYPGDGSWAEASGRRGSALAERDGAAHAAEVPSLDLRGYTTSFWFRIDDLAGTLLHTPGMTVRIGEAGRQLRDYLDEAERRGMLTGKQVERALASDTALMALIRELHAQAGKAMGGGLGMNGVDKDRNGVDDGLEASMQSPAFRPYLDGDSLRGFADRIGLPISLAFLRMTRNVHWLEVDIDSADGRRVAVPLNFRLEPRKVSILAPAKDLLDARVEQWALADSTVLRRGEWHQLVLALDVGAGELRGMLDGRQLATVPLPKGFALRSAAGSMPREVRVGPVQGGLSELLLLNGTPLPSSSNWRYLASRPRVDGPAVTWSFDEGHVLPGRIYGITINGLLHEAFRARFAAVPGVSNRYVLEYPAGDIQEWVWDEKELPPGVSRPRQGHNVMVAAHPTLAPRLVGGRVRVEWAAPAAPTQWELRPVDGGEPDQYSLHCASDGPWQGWALSVKKTGPVAIGRPMQAPLPAGCGRALELDPAPSPAAWSLRKD